MDKQTAFDPKELYEIAERIGTDLSQVDAADRWLWTAYQQGAFCHSPTLQDAADRWCWLFADVPADPVNGLAHFLLAHWGPATIPGFPFPLQPSDACAFAVGLRELANTFAEGVEDFSVLAANLAEVAGLLESGADRDQLARHISERDYAKTANGVQNALLADAPAALRLQIRTAVAILAQLSVGPTRRRGLPLREPPADAAANLRAIAVFLREWVVRETAAKLPTRTEGTPTAAAIGTASTTTPAPAPIMPGVGKETLALVALAQHPDWSDTTIAKAIGCSRTSIYRWEKYRQAREILAQGKSDLPSGSKDEDGNVDAWEG